MLHESHASISRPALLVVVADNILVVGVRMLGEVPLNELPSLLSCEPANRHRHTERAGVRVDGRARSHLKKMCTRST